MKLMRVVQVFAFAAAIPAFSTGAQAASCQANVRATAKSDQVTDEAIIKVWAVEADTQEQCAKVYVDLITTERLFDGEEITSTHRGWRKVDSQHGTYKVNYRIAKDSTLTNWEFKLAKCVVCGTE